jgi:hypothetical protein
MKSKVMSSKSKAFVKAGPASMLPKKGAGPQKPGTSAQVGNGGGKWAKAGGPSMAPKTGARAVTPGRTAK